MCLIDKKVYSKSYRSRLSITLRCFPSYARTDSDPSVFSLKTSSKRLVKHFPPDGHLPAIDGGARTNHIIRIRGPHSSVNWAPRRSPRRKAPEAPQRVYSSLNSSDGIRPSLDIRMKLGSESQPTLDRISIYAVDTAAHVCSIAVGGFVSRYV
jgi:hypothetical protein